MNSVQIPRIPLDLRDHRIAITITWSIIFTGSGLLPVVLYLTLTKVAQLPTWIVLTVITSIIGVGSVGVMLRRTWQLIRPGSTCRTHYTTWYQLDYFQWNFFFGFLYIAVLMTVAISLSIGHDTDTSIRLISLPLPLLTLQISSQLVLASILVHLRAKYPFRISSMEKGVPVRPGSYTIVEDVVTVDGGQGEAFRQLLDARYRASKPIRVLLHRLDWVWGVSGCAIGIILISLIGTQSNMDVLFIIGWLVPWGWAVVLALVTRSMWQAALRREKGAIGPD